MRAINESSLQSCLDSGSTKRLTSFRKRLRTDNSKVVFDDQTVNLVKEFASKPANVRVQLEYLDNLTDPDGVRFARSIKEYSKMEEVWNEFNKKEKDSFRWSKNFQTAERIVMERYSKARLRTLQYHDDQDIEDALTDLGTSTGWTSVVEGFNKKRDVIVGSFQHYKRKEDLAKREGSFQALMLPGVRTQCSGEYTEDGKQTNTCKHKTRPIWMVDVYTVIAERMWAKPLTKWLSGYAYSAVGKDDHDLFTRIGSMRISKWNYISVDYSKYDSSIPSWLIDSAFRVIKAAFVSQDEDLLNVLKDDFICKNLVTADGVVYVNHGNPSGSGFTTIVNGICNEIMTECWGSYLNMNSDLEYMIMGDDNLIYFNGKVDKGIIASYLLHNFGVKVNEDKTTIGSKGQDPEFLSRTWTLSGAYRHPNILLSKIAFPEKFRDHTKIDPIWVIYSYILGYPMGMKELIDVPRFMKYASESLRNFDVEKVLNLMPYNVQLAYRRRGCLPGLTPKEDWAKTRPDAEAV